MSAAVEQVVAAIHAEAAAANIVPCKGRFEEACTSVEDTFAFVSLDMDLHDPMLAGLEYFYPRLSPGGYMFLHDYNHADIQGVKPIIREYEQRHGHRLARVPIPDQGGTLVIMKY